MPLREGPRILEVIVALRLFIIAGVAVIALIGGLISTGLIGGRTEELFVAEYGSPRTTSEWIAFLYEYEKDQRDGVHILQKRKDNYLRVTAGIEISVGPDPAALPVIFATLKDDSPPNHRGRQLAQNVLKKFLSKGTAPLYGDVKAALQDENSEIVLWAIKLSPLVDRYQASLKPFLEELSHSADAVTAAAATESLTKLSAG